MDGQSQTVCELVPQRLVKNLRHSEFRWLLGRKADIPRTTSRRSSFHTLTKLQSRPPRTLQSHSHVRILQNRPNDISLIV